MISKHILGDIFKRVWVNFFYIVKWFHLFLSNANNSIYY